MRSDQELERKNLDCDLKDTIKRLNFLYADIGKFSEQLSNKEAREHCIYGLGTRIQYIRRCVVHFCNIVPPLPGIRRFSENDELDFNIFVHKFYSSIIACMDNLAWIYFNEKNIKDEKLTKDNTNLFNSTFYRNLKENPKLVRKIKENRKWFEHLREARDPEAHRVPPSIVFSFKAMGDKLPKKELDALLDSDDSRAKKTLFEYSNFGYYEPVFSHAILEKKESKFFYPQLVLDSQNFEAVIRFYIKHF